jgi:hypothetical protein
VLTDSGTYRVDALRVDINNVRLVFTVVATGAEAAAIDLDAETFTTLIIFIP